MTNFLTEFNAAAEVLQLYDELTGGDGLSLLRSSSFGDNAACRLCEETSEVSLMATMVINRILMDHNIQFWADWCCKTGNLAELLDQAREHLKSTYRVNAKELFLEDSRVLTDFDGGYDYILYETIDPFMFRLDGPELQP